jgi:DNA-binding transcriptional ArsR family regulator
MNCNTWFQCRTLGAVAADWTFLTNHSHVLLSIGAEPELTIREVAVRVGITERAAQRILADLIEGGYVEAERVGRRNHYKVNGDLPLRHPLERENPVSALLALTAPGRKKKARTAARD